MPNGGSEPVVMVQAPPARQISRRAGRDTGERLFSVGTMFQAYRDLRTHEIMEQDFVEDETYPYCTFGFTPLSDLFSLGTYIAFPLGLAAGIWAPIEERSGAQAQGEGRTTETLYSKMLSYNKERLETLKTLKEIDNLIEPPEITPSPNVQIFYKREIGPDGNPVWKPVYKLQEAGKWPHPDAFPFGELVEGAATGGLPLIPGAGRGLSSYAGGVSDAYNTTNNYYFFRDEDLVNEFIEYLKEDKEWLKEEKNRILLSSILTEGELRKELEGYKGKLKVADMTNYKGGN